MKNKIGYLLICIGLILIIFVFYKNSRVSQTTRVFSSYSVLSSSWQNYKAKFLNSDGRIVDPQMNNETTSEAQSYALLRSVWSDDKTSFDLIWKFTKNNMQRKSDHLFGWQWGKQSDGTYGFMPNGGNNSAADADSDIALALILASYRWHDTSYLQQAKPILNDMWNIETGVAAGNRYLVAGNWAKSSNELIIDPSYFAPYAWRIFAKVDQAHDWNGLVNPAYTLLNQAGSVPLDRGKACGLPPDWLAMNTSNGNLSAANITNLTTNYSFDAMRIPWRIALDYIWNKDPQAKAYLINNYNILDNEYKNNGKLTTTFAHDCSIVNDSENPAMYATSIGYFMLADPKTAASVYQNKIIKLYSNDQGSFNSNIPYYEQNWLWFAAAMYNHALSSYIGS